MNKSYEQNKFTVIIKVSFIIYIILLLRFVVFKYTIQDSITILNNLNMGKFHQHLGMANFKPFLTINKYIDIWEYKNSLNTTIFLNLFGNIIAFIPLGIYLPLSHKLFKSLLVIPIISLLVPITIESLQLITTLGSFDIDDIILNSIGIMIGYLCYTLISLIYKLIKKS